MTESSFPQTAHPGRDLMGFLHRCRTVSWLAPLLLTACAAQGPTPAATSNRQAAPAASLTNTYWKLLTVGGTSVASPPGAREPHLILQLDQRRVAGFSGCNLLMGGYQVDGGRLTFSQMAGTMMACTSTPGDVTRCSVSDSTSSRKTLIGKKAVGVGAGN